MAAPNEVYELTFFTRMVDQLAVNVVHMQCTAVVGVSPTDKEIVDRFSSDMSGRYKALYGGSYTYMGARLKRIVPALGFPQISTQGQGGGVQASECLPSQTCGLVSWYTDVASRNARGRTYLPAGTEGTNSPGGQPDAVGTQNIRDWALAMTTTWVIAPVPGASATFVHGVYSKGLGALFRTTRFVVRISWATQRRRSRITRPDNVVVPNFAVAVPSSPSITLPDFSSSS